MISVDCISLAWLDKIDFALRVNLGEPTNPAVKEVGFLIELSESTSSQPRPYSFAIFAKGKTFWYTYIIGDTWELAQYIHGGVAILDRYQPSKLRRRRIYNAIQEWAKAPV